MVVRITALVVLVVLLGASFHRDPVELADGTTWAPLPADQQGGARCGCAER
jgi:hypothetical protein